MLWRHGLAGLLEGLALVRGMLDRYWEQLHPLPDEGDYYMRHPVSRMGRDDGECQGFSPPLAIGFVYVTQNGLTLNQCIDARGVPLETEAGQSSSAYEKRQEAVGAGKTTPEEFNQAFDGTPKAFYRSSRPTSPLATKPLRNSTSTAA